MRWPNRGSRVTLIAAALTVLGAALASAAHSQETPQRPAQPIELTGPIVQGGYAIGRLPKGSTELDFAGQPVRIAADGRFIIGFGRNAPPTGWLEARMADGKIVRQAVPIGRRAFSAEEVPGLRHFVPPTPPSAEAQALRRVELANIRAARFGNSAALHWAERFRWPVLGRVSAEFGSQRRVDGKPVSTHYGVDVAAPIGTLVRAPAGGRVKLAAADYSLEGGIVIIDHGHGLTSTFLHLSRLDVKTGHRLAAGDSFGAVGNTGRSTGPHLHWSMHWGRTRIDPALFVEPMDREIAQAAAANVSARSASSAAPSMRGR